jgi:2-polyprenyl-3-methyl-5-hydroxy-6-metoxy-1,4-benzoquinol methylase
LPQILESLKPYASLETVVAAVLETWPDHEPYIEKRFSNNAIDFLERSDEVAQLALAIMGDDIAVYCRDYRWMCERFLDEEIYFRRYKAYRISTFREAYEEIYGNDDYMPNYVRGILISQLMWTPHSRAIDFFRTDFLTNIPDNGSYLEVGPGTGLFLYFAASRDSIDYLEAWDVSASSIAETKATLEVLGVKRDVSIIEQDVLVAPSRHNEFDAAVISEVLEHLEAPDRALRSLHAALKPGGRVFINVPINSPAPDHIYLWRSIEEIRDFVRAQGFEIDAFETFPVTGATIEKAIRRDLSISCVVIGRKP